MKECVDYAQKITKSVKLYDQKQKEKEEAKQKAKMERFARQKAEAAYKFIFNFIKK